MPVTVRAGASTFAVALPGKQAVGNDLRYQAIISRTARECSMATVHGPVPVQAPLHPVKVDDGPGTADSVTCVAVGKLAVHVVPQRYFYRHAATPAGLYSLLESLDPDLHDVYSLHYSVGGLFDRLREDAGRHAQQRCASVRGRSEPPEATRMRAYSRRDALTEQATRTAGPVLRPSPGGRRPACPRRFRGPLRPRGP